MDEAWEIFKDILFGLFVFVCVALLVIVFIGFIVAAVTGQPQPVDKDDTIMLLESQYIMNVASAL